MDDVKWDRILATTDFSPFGDKAVRYAHKLAEQFAAELHVLHVAPDATEAATLFGATGAYDPAEATNALTGWLCRLLGESGTIRRVQSVQIGKDIAEKILHYAQTQAIDLVVMASHGRTGVAHLWLGSIAEKVIRSAHCPVLVLRPALEPDADKRSEAK